MREQCEDCVPFIFIGSFCCYHYVEFIDEVEVVGFFDRCFGAFCFYSCLRLQNLKKAGERRIGRLPMIIDNRQMLPR